MGPSVKIFSGNSSNALAEKIAQRFECNLAKINIQNSATRIPANLPREQREVIMFSCSKHLSIQWTTLMELLLMIDAAKEPSAYKIIVIPYYGFARQDRKDKPRVAIGANLSLLFEAAGADRIITMDLCRPDTGIL